MERQRFRNPTQDRFGTKSINGSGMRRQLLARSRIVALAIVLTAIVPTLVAAQAAAPQPLPPELAAIVVTVAEMAGLKSLSPEIVADIKSWIEPTEPCQIVG